ncbi:MAG: selenide, water dikinase SelD [Sediminibacterium sp.]|nr:selenide, water dikinase SelD [Sediminibacterium sp.]
MTHKKLTDFSKGVGCGCKIPPNILSKFLQDVGFKNDDPNLLIGNNNHDDAAVYLLNENMALIATTDFFAPIVDDPFLFGQIAAANAISDVYAMGGNPILALGILAWPTSILPIELATKVMQGATEMCKKAGMCLSGGHSIESDIPLFGLAVNGIINPNNIKKNNTPQLGDALFLTKPLGSGLITTALKKNIIELNEILDELKIITQLNYIGKICGELDFVHAMTDITGFGLIGHLAEMMNTSTPLTANIYFNNIPIIEKARYLITENCTPDATFRNWNTYQPTFVIEEGVDISKAFKILPDPQTNGGLLISVDKCCIDSFKQILQKENIIIHQIGEVTEFKQSSIKINNN